MLELIGYFMPAFIAVSIVLFLDFKERKAYQIVCMYSNFCLFVNLLSLIIVRFIFGKTKLDFFMSTGYSVKWLLLTSFIAIFIGMLFVVIKKNMTVSFELMRVKDEKKQ